MPTRTSSFRPRAPALPWLPPAGAEPLRRAAVASCLCQSRCRGSRDGAPSTGAEPVWRRCEVQPLRDGCAEPMHSGGLARSSCCSCAMAARNSCVVTAWRGPASARQRSRAHPWRWRLHATPPHPVPPRVGRGCAANHARRRRTRWGLGRSCGRGALYEVVIRIGFAVAGAASRRRRRITKVSIGAERARETSGRELLEPPTFFFSFFSQVVLIFSWAHTQLNLWLVTPLHCDTYRTVDAVLYGCMIIWDKIQMADV